MTELLTVPVIEPAETVPPETSPVRSPVSVTEVEAPETLPVREAAVTVPPVMAEERAPATLTVPSEMPPEVMVAAAAKRVLPAPESEARVMVPELPVKYSASVAGFALVTAPTERPLLERVADPVESRERVAPDLKSAAVRMAPFTVIAVVPAREPALAESVPPEIVVVPV